MIYGCPCGNMSRPHIHVGSHYVTCLKCKRVALPRKGNIKENIEIWNQNVLDEVENNKTMMKMTINLKDAKIIYVVADTPCIYSKPEEIEEKK